MKREHFIRLVEAVSDSLPTEFQERIHNDGDTSQMSMRTVQFVNRSHHQQLFHVHVNAKLGFTERSFFEFGYQRRLRTFLSKEPFDVLHNGRTDARDSFSPS